MNERCVACGEIIPEGRQVCLSCIDKVAKNNKSAIIKVGDTIKCYDADEAIEYMKNLSKERIETDFCYEVNGIHGIYLEVINIEEE